MGNAVLSRVMKGRVWASGASQAKPDIPLSEVRLDERQWYRVGEQGVQRVMAAQKSGAEALRVHVRHVLVEDAEKAKRVVHELNSGTPFAQVAKRYSECTKSAQKGGELGWLDREQAVREFQDAVFVVPKGFKDVVHTRFGIHVIEVLDRVDPSAATAHENETQSEGGPAAAEYRETLNAISGVIQSKKWGSSETYTPPKDVHVPASMRSDHMLEQLPRERALPQTSIPEARRGVLNQLQMQKLLLLHWDDELKWTPQRLAKEFQLDEETVRLLIKYTCAFKTAEDSSGRVRAFSKRSPEQMSFREVLASTGELHEHEQFLSLSTQPRRDSTQRKVPAHEKGRQIKRPQPPQVSE